MQIFCSSFLNILSCQLILNIGIYTLKVTTGIGTGGKILKVGN